MYKAGGKNSVKRRAKSLAAVIFSTATIMTTFLAPNVAMAAEEEVLPIVAYDFEDGIGEKAEAIVQGGDAYEGEVVYGEGRNSGRAIQMGDYGLKLNEQNLGSEYTVSVWVKPQEEIPNNTPIVFIGYGQPEKWVAIAGKMGGEQCKTWTHDGDQFRWKEMNEFQLPVDTWTQLAVTQKEDTVAVYVNGRKLSEDTAATAMEGENQDICLGVNDWDTTFTGLMDDVRVYNTALSEEQIKGMYDGPTQEQILEEEGISVTPTLSITEGNQGKIRVTLPEEVTDAVITYTSDKEEIASVAGDGTVTGIASGKANITTRVTLGEVVKTGVTQVEVTAYEGEVNEALAVEYMMDGLVNDQLFDASGHGNHGTLYHPETVEFVNDNGRNVIDIQDPASYISIPIGIMDSLTDKEQFTIEITYSRSAKAGGNSWLFGFGSIPKATGTNYLFYCPYFSFGNGEVRAGIKDATTEKLFTTGVRNQNDTYYTVDMVVKDGVITLFIDGIKIGGQLDSGFSIVEDVVNQGTADGILGFIGKSCWAQDTNFVGRIDSFRIYDKAMNEEEVQNSNPEYLENLRNKLEEGVQEAELLGDRNVSAEEVRYDLALPQAVDELEIIWKSSDTSVLTGDGKVLNGKEDREVTLTATVVSGTLTAEKEFTFIIKPVERGDLDLILKEAQDILKSPYITSESAAALKKAADKALDVSSQMKVDASIKELQKAMEKVQYKAEYENPFAFLEKTLPLPTVELKEKESRKLFELPKELEGLVTVSYESNLPSVAEYTNGILTAKKAGTATVFVIVKANCDGYAQRYKTEVKVTAEAKTPGQTESPTEPAKTEGDWSKVAVKIQKAKIAKGGKTNISVTLPQELKALSPAITYKAQGAVSVTKAGRVTGKKVGKGSVTVTVSAGGQSIRKKLEVSVGAITGKDKVKAGKSLTLKVKGLKGKVKWSVKGKKLAAISKKGKLTAKKKGKVVVTANVSGIKISKAIRIR